MIALRPYQVDAIERVRASLRAGKRRPLFVLPTGGGKTVVASSIIVSSVARAKRSLFVAHRRELIKQAYAKLVRSGIPHDQVGIVMAGIPTGNCELFAADPATMSDELLWQRYARRRPTAPVQVASIDTLRQRAVLTPAPDLVIIDEAHRALSASYTALCATYPLAVTMGLTATPYRADNRGLGLLFDDLIVGSQPPDLVSLGAIIEPRVFTVPASALPDLSGVKLKGHDYDAEQLDGAVNRRELVGNIVEHWQRAAEGRRTVVFAASVAHSKHIVERFRSAGIAAEHLDGTTPTAERDGILARLAEGATRVVGNCGVLCEGWDMPAVKCLVLARPTKSTGLYLQMAGRILRPWEGVSAVILDHAGSVHEHGFPTEPREFDLHPARRKKRDVEPRAKTCPECLAVLALATRRCPECGRVFEASVSSGHEEATGDLVEITRSEFERQRFAQWDALVEEWCATNAAREAMGGAPVRPGWLYIAYGKRYGLKPPRGAKFPKLTAAQKSKLAAKVRTRAESPSAAPAIVEYAL